MNQRTAENIPGMHSSEPNPDVTTDALPAASEKSSDFTAAYVPGHQDATAIATEGEIPGGRYRLLHEIARGGMGVVYRAYDNSFARTLAIKVLRPMQGAHAAAQRRFMDEAKITGQLQHPGIPPAHEVGQLADGRPFFSMKLIEGRTLAALLAERPTPQADLPRFLKAFEQIAQTIGYAHAQRVIHRDLKPMNVMVGEFGEVQVMDWGLAKRLDQGPVADEPATRLSPERLADTASLDQTVDPEPQTADDRTHAGDVLGTFSYMAPEQARGEVEALGARCDVFGLGAILCTILTGKPPYYRQSGEDLWRQAREADLADAWARLEASGADSELVRLAKACLAPRPEGRPADGGAVAAEVSRHLASMQARLQETRVAHAEAEVKAQEARKQRRLAVALALAVVGLVVGASVFGWWYVNDQAQRDREEAKQVAESDARAQFLNREVGAALDEAGRLRQELHQRLGDRRRAAVLLSELHLWRTLVESALAAWKRADTLAAGGQEMLTQDLRARLASVAEQLQSDERDRQMAFELDRIRFESSIPEKSQMNVEAAIPKLAQVFRKAGFDVEVGDPKEVGARIRASMIRLPLVAGLDYSAQVTQNANLRARFCEAARTADPDPWRDRFREADRWADTAHLQALARDVDLTQQSPQLLAALAQRFRHTNIDPLGMLNRALIHHPHDFWLFFELGLSSRPHVEQIGAYRAALAVRPDSGVTYYQLGDIYLFQKKLEEAAVCYRRSIDLVPDYAGTHNNLGLVYDQQGKKPEAIACFERAIELHADGDVLCESRRHISRDESVGESGHLSARRGSHRSEKSIVAEQPRRLAARPGQIGRGGWLLSQGHRSAAEPRSCLVQPGARPDAPGQVQRRARRHEARA